MAKKIDVVYYYHSDVGAFHYGRNHPMKPQRLAACNDLVAAYGLYEHMKVVENPKLTVNEILTFHEPDYIAFLQKASKGCSSEIEPLFTSFNIGEDCPVFPRMYDYCSLYSGGSVEGAKRLNHKLADIVINWSGGLHHAKKGEASGFCYVNDIVLGIIELLKYHKRVLYIDIDIHHGDGVQEAFNNTDRVMTVSFHRYGNFFPGTGSVYDRGVDAGKYFAVNVPLHEGITDRNYHSVFQPIISSVMENYSPEAIVLQCGADSLGEDRLGSFNLSFDGHARCVRFVKSFRKPMLVVGGGGYTLRNVARCWANETGVCLDIDMPNEIPNTASSSHYTFFSPDFLLKPDLTVRHLDQNTEPFLNTLKSDILACLRQIQGAPSVQMAPIPGIREDEIESIEKNDKKDREEDSLKKTAEEPILSQYKRMRLNMEHPIDLLNSADNDDDLEPTNESEQTPQTRRSVSIGRGIIGEREKQLMKEQDNERQLRSSLKRSTRNK